MADVEEADAAMLDDVGFVVAIAAETEREAMGEAVAGLAALSMVDPALLVTFAADDAIAIEEGEIQEESEAASPQVE